MSTKCVFDYSNPGDWVSSAMFDSSDRDSLIRPGDAGSLEGRTVVSQSFGSQGLPSTVRNSMVRSEHESQSLSAGRVSLRETVNTAEDQSVSITAEDQGVSITVEDSDFKASTWKKVGDSIQQATYKLFKDVSKLLIPGGTMGIITGICSGAFAFFIPSVVVIGLGILLNEVSNAYDEKQSEEKFDLVEYRQNLAKLEEEGCFSPLSRAPYRGWKATKPRASETRTA